MQSEDTETRRDAYETSQIRKDTRILGSLMTFNSEHGYIEAVLRGLRPGFITEFEYGQLCLCENLDDVRLCLGDTDYKTYIQNLGTSPSPEQIFDKCRQKFVDEFDYLRKEAKGQVSSFLEFITYEYQIQSIQFVISSLVKGAKPETLLSKCHPLGKSPHLKTILTFDNFGSEDGLLELYRTVLIDTPVACYFEKYFNGEIKSDQSGSEIQRHYDEREIDIITNMLEKLWLEDFYKYSQSLGGETAEAMKALLEFEADRRAIQITINSFGTNLNDDQNRNGIRQELYCSFGKLYPYSVGENGFRKVKDMDTLRTYLAPYKVYSDLLRKAQDNPVGSGRGEGAVISAFTDVLYQHEVHLSVLAFEGQSHLACFYAYTKLKQMEHRNLKWILSCIFTKRDAKHRSRWIRTF